MSDKQITIRWWIESGRSSPGDVFLEYEAINSSNTVTASGGIKLLSEVKRPKYWPEDMEYPRARPAVTVQTALGNLIQQYNSKGYLVTTENGHYERTWVKHNSVPTTSKALRMSNEETKWLISAVSEQIDKEDAEYIFSHTMLAFYGRVIKELDY